MPLAGQSLWKVVLSMMRTRAVSVVMPISSLRVIALMAAATGTASTAAPRAAAAIFGNRMGGLRDPDLGEEKMGDTSKPPPAGRRFREGLVGRDPQGVMT